MTTSESVYTDGRYLDGNPDWHTSDSAWKAAHIFRMIKQNSLNPNRVAEVGCGAGEILNQLSLGMPANVSFYGYDISPQAIELCMGRTRSNLTFQLGDLAEIDIHFDLLLAIDVFEHVENYLGFIRSLTNKATYTIFHVPLDLSVQTVLRSKALSATRREVGHLHYFTEQTTLDTIQDCGYNVMDKFFTARGVELGGGGFGRKFAIFPRWLAAKVSPSFASRTLGGFSLMVLAKASP